MMFRILFWFFLAIVIACIEIEAEGKFGWAEKMPTWYRTHGVLAKLYGAFMNHKPLTGYHTFMFFVPLMMVHIPFIEGAPWTWSAELCAIALYISWSALWDFLWFVLNPHYTIHNFKRSTVWWHAKSPWLLGLPFDYYAAWGTSLLLAFIASRLGDHEALLHHGAMLIGFTALTLVTIIFAPFYHQWYWNMRTSDDREKARIFHPNPQKEE